MKYLPYVLKHLKRNWIRTASTLAGLVLCIFLICVLQTVLDAMRQTTADADPSRIITRHAVSVNFRLPLSYKPRIQAIPGVRTVAVWTWFGGVYRDIKDFFPNFAVESEDYFQMVGLGVAAGFVPAVLRLNTGPRSHSPSGSAGHRSWWEWGSRS